MLDLFFRIGHLAMASSPSSQDAAAQLDAKNAKVGKMAIGVIVGMFLLGFASIPLYRWVCAQTDPGGSSWFIGEPDVYEGVEVDEERELTIRFNTNVERQLPWSFQVDQRTMTINAGERAVATFDAQNTATTDVTGKAVYDISPPEAAPYFKKQECFCFIEQTLSGGEEMSMPLVYWFESDLPDHVDTITLGYTFFNSESSRARAATP